jgi:pyrophosphatase PpaX
MTASYSCILFDVDNTLADTSPVIRASLLQCGCPDVDNIPDAEIRGVSPPELLKRRGRSDLSNSFWNIYEELLPDMVRLLDTESCRVLRFLDDRGTRLGIVTSSRSSTTGIVLEACKIRSFFSDCLVTYGTCKRRKPHPDPILHALSMLEAKPARTLYVGDALKDATASRAAGVDFGLAAWSDCENDAMMVSDVILKGMAALLDYT